VHFFVGTHIKITTITILLISEPFIKLEIIKVISRMLIVMATVM